MATSELHHQLDTLSELIKELRSVDVLVSTAARIKQCTEDVKIFEGSLSTVNELEDRPSVNLLYNQNQPNNNNNNNHDSVISTGTSSTHNSTIEGNNNSNSNSNTNTNSPVIIREDTNRNARNLIIELTPAQKKSIPGINIFLLFLSGILSVVLPLILLSFSYCNSR